VHLLEKEKRKDVPPKAPRHDTDGDRGGRSSPPRGAYRKDKPPPSRDVRGKSDSGRR
jgi:hypothetical protein